MKITVEDFVRIYEEKFKNSNDYKKQIDEIVEKWGYYRNKILNGTLTGLEYISDKANFEGKKYKSLHYFLEHDCNDAFGSFGGMIASDYYLRIKGVSKNTKWFVKEGSHAESIELITDEDKEKALNEIRLYLKELMEKKTLSEVADFVDKKDNVSKYFRAKTFTFRMIVLNSCLSEYEFRNEIVPLYRTENIEKLNLMDGEKDLFESARKEGNYIIKNNKLLNTTLNLLGIENPDIYELRKIESFFWHFDQIIVNEEKVEKENRKKKREEKKNKKFLTIDEWKETLGDEGIINSVISKYLKYWYEKDNYTSSCKEAGLYFMPDAKNSYASISSTMTAASKKIGERYGIKYEDNDGYINIMMDIDVNSDYVNWTLKKELVEALKNLYEKEGEKMISNEKQKISLNTILFGPPGTGKTYNSKIYAVAITSDKYSGDLDLVKTKDYENEIIPEYNALEAAGKISFITFHQSYGYEDFIEGIKPKIDEKNNIYYKVEDGIFKAICNRAKSNPKEKFAIIIDEINRGNISKIFGELITLIEESKRSGEKEGMNCKLPYSYNENNELFSVPSNLYIVGTMNTADRSIALMDTALRRRFDFREMKPDSSLLDSIIIEGKDINLHNMLDAMNNRIKVLYDREHMLGHSFLLKLKNDNSFSNLKNIFKNEIIPLLQEFFYDDYSKIRLVLGDDGKDEKYQFIHEKKIESGVFKTNKVLDDLPENIYEINDAAFEEDDSYRLIY